MKQQRMFMLCHNRNLYEEEGSKTLKAIETKTKQKKKNGKT